MVFDITIFGIHLTLDPVAFTVFGWKIYWYGIIIALAFLLALIYCLRRTREYGLDMDRVIDVVLVSAPVAIIFARLYYILFELESINSFADIIDIHNGGLAIYGGIIGAFLAAIFMCKWRKVNTLALFDLAGLGFLLAQAIGRWGNFVNQEAYGSFTGSDWWGMTSNKIVQEYGSGLVHPCFLYESVWCLLGFIVLHFYSKRSKFRGEIFLAYLSWYGFGRFFIEGLRTDSLKLGSVRVSQVLAAVLCIVSTALIIYIRYTLKNRKRQPAYTPQFTEEIAAVESSRVSREKRESSESPDEIPSHEDGSSTTAESDLPSDQAEPSIEGGFSLQDPKSDEEPRD